MLSPIAGGFMNWFPYMLVVLGIFTTVTMWAVILTEGCRKIKLQYYGFKLASSSRWSDFRFLNFGCFFNRDLHSSLSIHPIPLFVHACAALLPSWVCELLIWRMWMCSFSIKLHAMIDFRNITNYLESTNIHWQFDICKEL